MADAFENALLFSWLQLPTYFSRIYADPCVWGSQYLCPIGTQKLFSKVVFSVLSGHLAAPFHSCHSPNHDKVRSRAAYFPSLPISLFHSLLCMICRECSRLTHGEILHSEVTKQWWAPSYSIEIISLCLVCDCISLHNQHFLNKMLISHLLIILPMSFSWNIWSYVVRVNCENVLLLSRFKTEESFLGKETK